MAEGDKLVTHGLMSIENMGALECELVGSVNIQATATLLVARCHGGVLTTRHYQNAIKYGTPKQRRQYEKTACVLFDTEKKLSFLVSEGVATMEEVAHLADIINKVALIETSNAKSCLLVLGRYFTKVISRKKKKAKYGKLKTAPALLDLLDASLLGQQDEELKRFITSV